MNSVLNLKYITSVSKLIPTKNVQIYNNEIVLIVDELHIIDVLLFLKYHCDGRYEILTTISGADYPWAENRFEISYDLLSIRFNNRVRVKICTTEIASVDSLKFVYISADWWEREIWDLYGVFFRNHPDLRRILTDYGFEGHPLRKDFPLSGYVEVRYDEQEKKVICESVEFIQEFRTFDFTNPWDQLSIELEVPLLVELQEKKEAYDDTFFFLVA
jgi:NADH/F420H2 dehydrogenase subunit C